MSLKRCGEVNRVLLCKAETCAVCLVGFFKVLVLILGNIILFTPLQLFFGLGLGLVTLRIKILHEKREYFFMVFFCYFYSSKCSKYK